MKKQLAAAAAAALALTGACALTGTAMADTTPSPRSSDVTVQYSVKSDFDLAIPANVVLSEKESVTRSVGVRSANLVPGDTLNITVAGTSFIEDSNTLTLANEKDPNVKAKTTLTDEDGKAVANGATVATFSGYVPDLSTKGLTFSAITDANGRKKVQAGNYRTVLTFTASVSSGQ